MHILKQFDYKQSSHFRFRDDCMRPDGASIKFWNKSQGYVIYDKCGEIIANQKTKEEQKLAQYFENGKIRVEIIRFELSLERKQNMDAVLRRLFDNKQKNFLFEEIITRPDIAKRALLETFDKVFRDTYAIMLTLAQKQDNQLEQLIQQKNLSFQKEILLRHIVNKCTKIGLNATLEEMKSRFPSSSYGRHRREVVNIMRELAGIGGEIMPLVQFFRQEHEKFELKKGSYNQFEL